MKITAVRLIAYTGEMTFPGVFWEERLVRPLDLYPEHRDDAPAWLEPIPGGSYRMASTFLRIETDEGYTASEGLSPMIRRTSSLPRCVHS